MTELAIKDTGITALAQVQSELATELAGVDLQPLGGDSLPYIMWWNRPRYIDPVQREGGFVMPLDEVTKAGDAPQGTMPVTVTFDDGHVIDAVYTQQLTFVPMAQRFAYVISRTGESDIILPQDFDFSEAERMYGAKPKSKLHVKALVKGGTGVMVVILTFGGMVTKEVMTCLREHDRRVRALCREAGIDKAVATHAWRMFSVTIKADGFKEVGSVQKNKIAAPTIAAVSPVYMGPKLKDEYFDAIEVADFEKSWQVSEITTAAPEALAAPPEPDFPDDF